MSNLTLIDCWMKLYFHVSFYCALYANTFVLKYLKWKLKRRKIMLVVPTTFELNYYSNEKAVGWGCAVESAVKAGRRCILCFLCHFRYSFTEHKVWPQMSYKNCIWIKKDWCRKLVLSFFKLWGCFNECLVFHVKATENYIQMQSGLF